MPFQLIAANPQKSIWVEASAGTGKTKVLTDRVLNLLLRGVEPAQILCLTFTRAAAAEMANRLRDRLSVWSKLDSGTLQKELDALGKQLPGAAERARLLFSIIMDRSVRIQTIHGFCQSLLKTFPLEAGIPPYFTVIANPKETLESALHQIIHENSINLEPLVKHISPVKFNNFIFKSLGEYRKGKFSITSLKASLGISNEITRESLRIQLENAEKYLTKTGSLRKAFQNSPEGEQVLAASHHLKHLEIAEASIALYHLLDRLWTVYEQKKQAQALLDYDDLIDKTATLLEQQEPWVMYKLDGGLRHILIDEAQDTNPQQWRIIQALTQDFFSDTSKERTLFIVGDPKQSIYSFQGADPQAFLQMRNRLVNEAAQMESVDLSVSFRSAPVILNLVDQVIRLHSSPILDVPRHLPYRKNAWGLVELWPLLAPSEKEETAPWDVAPSCLQASARMRLANYIAVTLKKWFETGKLLPSCHRKIEPKDIMILVRHRDEFAKEMVAALKRLHIPVAGLDRFILNDQWVVWDLLSLADFLLLPEDDMSLAIVLKGPCIAMSEEDLFEISAERGEQSLWQSLKAARERKSVFSNAVAFLENLLLQVGYRTPYAFYSVLLLEKRAIFLELLGRESGEPLDEFLNLCRVYEQSHPPTLQGFVSWIRSSPIEIKRSLDQSIHNEVRLMTVHGAKGLESPIVFLPDTTQWPREESSLFWEKDYFVWCPKADMRTPTINQLSQSRAAEYHRLLYVALTRARDALYVCGWGEAEPLSWYDLIQTVVKKEGAPIEMPEAFQGKGYRWEEGEPSLYEEKNLAQESKIDIPSWLYTPLDEEKKSLDIKESDENAYAKQKGIWFHRLLEHATDFQQPAFASTLLWDCPDILREEILQQTASLLSAQHLAPFFALPALTEVSVTGYSPQGKPMKYRIDRLIFDDENKIIYILDYKSGHKSEHKKSYDTQLRAYQDIIKNIYKNYSIRLFLLYVETQELIEVSTRNESD